MRFLSWTNLPAADILWAQMDNAFGCIVNDEGIALLAIGDTRPASGLVFESVLSLSEGTTIVGEQGEPDNTFAERLAGSVEGCEGMRRFAAASGTRLVYDAEDKPSLVFYDANGTLCAEPVEYKVVKLAPRDGGVTGTPGGGDDCDGKTDGNVGG